MTKDEAIAHAREIAEAARQRYREEHPPVKQDDLAPRELTPEIWAEREQWLVRNGAMPLPVVVAPDGNEYGASSCCLDCQAETMSPEPGAAEYYMVHDQLWEASGAPLRAYLCIGCLEKRLGRTLHRDDFTGAKVNDPDHPLWHLPMQIRTARLLDRLAREPADASLRAGGR